MDFLRETINDAQSKVRICKDGSLVAEVYAARTGIQDYHGSEIDKENQHGLRDKAIVKVYRPEGEVFNADSLRSFAAAPVTIDHPPVSVDATNWLDYGRGEIHGDIVRDGNKVRVPIIVRDAASVKSATTTHKQISMGYTSGMVFPKDGKHPDGTICDAYQTNIAINHIAFVPAARGGPELTIIDERALKDNTKMKLTIGDAKDVDLSDGAAVAVAIGALNTKLSDAERKEGEATAKLVDANSKLETKDGEIAALTAKLADAEITPEKLQQLADARAELIGKAKLIDAAAVVDGKSDAEIRRAVVSAKLGDAAKDMSDAAIEGAFTAFTANAPKQVQPLGAPVSVGDAGNKERDGYLARLTGKKDA